MRRIYRIITIISCLLCSVTASAKIIDPTGPSNPILERLALQLEKNGIDVRLGSNRGSSVPLRPTLMPLESFTSSVTPKTASSRFAALFENGVMYESALFAVDDRTGQPFKDPAKFGTMWSNYERPKRIFLSFSSNNMDYAKLASDSMNRAGFSTFIYTGMVGTKFNAVDTGNYFREAGNRFVLDTSESRKSNAVAVEAHMARGGKGTYRPIVPFPPFGPKPNVTTSGGSSNPGPGLSPTKYPCCQLCRYVNGALVGCTDHGCGPQCANAQ